MRLLVAGGAGYIGSRLVPALLQRGHAVDVLDLFWFGNRLPPAAGVFHGDVFDADERRLSGYDQAIFLAGLSNDPMADYSPRTNFVYNAAAPAYFGYVARRAGVRRLIYASTCSVYGRTSGLAREDHPTCTEHPYGLSKLQGELAVLQLRSAGFSVVCLRLGTVSGYSPRMRLDLIVNTMFAAAMSGEPVRVDNPEIWRPILGIGDATQACMRAVEVDPAVSGVFNVASGNHTVGEIAEHVRRGVERLTGHAVPVSLRRVPDGRDYRVSIDRARADLGFRPREDVEGIVRELAAHRDRFEDLGNPLYRNIEVFKRLGRAELVA
jgi:nucleoside-diphosphate-sugar epimerase